jgi:hypothetical protein
MTGSFFFVYILAVATVAARNGPTSGRELLQQTVTQSLPFVVDLSQIPNKTVQSDICLTGKDAKACSPTQMTERRLQDKAGKVFFANVTIDPTVSQLYGTYTYDIDQVKELSNLIVQNMVRCLPWRPSVHRALYAYRAHCLCTSILRSSWLS